MSGLNDFIDKAGAFANKAAEVAKDLANVTVAKTKQVSRIAKLNMDISGEKDTLKKLYAEIGRLYYESHKDAPEESFAQTFQEIGLAQGRIAAMEEEIAQLKQEIGDMDETAQDADFEAVVNETEAAADVEVEITVDTPPEADAPADAAPAQPDEPKPEDETES